MEREPADLRLLALGDSYTIGEGVTPQECWPLQLVRALRAAGRQAADPVIVARTGWTTDELSAGIEAAGIAGSFDLVTLLIGVNNQYRGRPLETYRLEFANLLQRAAGFAGGRAGRVLVLSIPDWGVTPFAAGRDRARITTEIDAFNQVKRASAQRAGARYVDVTPLSRRADCDESLLVADGLHPSGKLYAEWAALALTEALVALAGP